MKYLKITPLVFLLFTFDANAKILREDNCNIIGDVAFILMTQRQSGIPKEEAIKDFPFEKLTKDEEKIVNNLVETIYKTPVRDEFNSYEYLEKFMNTEKERCVRLVKDKI